MSFKKTEFTLYNRKHIEAEIKIKKNKLEKLKQEYNVISSPLLDGMPKGTTTSNPTEKNALRHAEKVEKLRRQIASQQQELDNINNALEILTPLEKEIVTLRYDEEKTWQQIAKETFYSKSGIYKKRQSIITKLDPLLK